MKVQVILPESSSTKYRLGLTVDVVEVASGEVASATGAASAGSGSARLAASARDSNWMRVAGYFSG